MPKGAKVAKYNKYTYQVEFYQAVETNPEFSIDEIKAKIKELGGVITLKGTKLVDEKPNK